MPKPAVKLKNIGRPPEPTKAEEEARSTNQLSYMKAMAKARCDACGKAFEHAKGPQEAVVCPRCNSGRITRLMGRIFIVPDGTLDASSPRLKRLLRTLVLKNRWVITIEGHAGALISDMEHLGIPVDERDEWRVRLQPLLERAGKERDKAQEVVEKYARLHRR